MTMPRRVVASIIALSFLLGAGGGAFCRFVAGRWAENQHLMETNPRLARLDQDFAGFASPTDENAVADFQARKGLREPFAVEDAVKGIDWVDWVLCPLGGILLWFYQFGAFRRIL